MVDDGLAVWPVGSSIEVVWESGIGDGVVVSLLWEVDNPLLVDDGSHDGLEFLEGGSIELLVDSGGPGGVGVVDGLDVDGEVEDEVIIEVGIIPISINPGPSTVVTIPQSDKRLITESWLEQTRWTSGTETSSQTPSCHPQIQ